jgi:transcriptional regulator with XRE-family HTH domain
MTALQPFGLDVVSPEDQRFFKALGARIAEQRKAQGFTQQQLADQLGLAQQVVASYEVGRRRVPISMLPALATALAVSVDTLLGIGNGAAKRGPTPKLHQQIERISQLPRAQQRFVTQILDTVITQAGR